ncbi:hypothetical protein [Alteromonas sp. ASW11-130]|uniref:hypothetical protein n=1 Tax=Alteromonas sp. ASW11-130 TaxID=3015775 RepID=UPI002241D5B9|nr:hypothetical protein [Alteromonas sp. ASW11-130]MCW8091289.1 hypothetical protein [Alteromonas sp. ASW11-130]
MGVKSHAVSKGFLISIFTSLPDKNTSQSFSKTFTWPRVTLDIDKDSSKNIIFDVDSEGFCLYLGDRHLGQDRDDFLRRLKVQNFDSLVGTRILFDNETGVLEIMSDFMGTEPVYYCQHNNQFWVSDRLENFSRLIDCTLQPEHLYTSVLLGATVGSHTYLKEVSQTRPLQKISFDLRSARLTTENDSIWSSDPDADVAHVYQQIDEQLYSVLQESPDTTLMLSAGWDSRVLMADPTRIKATYTHGDLKSREIRIAFKLGAFLDVPMNFVPLTESPYGAEVSYEMLARFGQCYFPHWYHASEQLAKISNLPLSAGLMVEHFSGHYGINSLPGKGRVLRLLHSMLTPGKYDKIGNEEAINYLAPALSSGFNKTPWFLRDDVDFTYIKKKFLENTQQCLSDYVDNGTSGIQELSERYKIEHSLRQYFAYQTKTACASLGYHHPFIDAKLAKLVLTLKYRHRINYKLSRHVVRSRAPELLTLPLAATLVKAGAPIVAQEASRVIRIGGEKIYSKATGNLPKGLGWNNFQFLNKTQAFHEYAEMLTADIWDKGKIHNFISNFCEQDHEAYSLLIMLTKMVTTDYKLNPNKYQQA